MADAGAREGFVGAPWGGTFRIISEGKLKDRGIGEVAVKSPSQMLGYWRAADQTAASRFDDYLLTGDIGELDQDQSLRLIGRNKHEINRGGVKVLAEEIDMLLERHESVDEACGFGVPDEISGEIVGAVVTTSDRALTPSALLEWCRENARPDAVPFRIDIVDDIPKNDRGKIVRKVVQDRMVAEWS